MSNLPQYPLGTNVYVPVANPNLISNYSRNPNGFKVNKVVMIVDVQHEQGLYLALDPAAESRTPINADGTIDLRSAVWADGAAPSVNFSKKQSFENYQTYQYAEAFYIGFRAAEQASWNIVADHAQSAASNLMTKRTIGVGSYVGNSSNWVDFSGASVNTNTASSLSGGQWDTGSSTTPYIQIGTSAIIRAVERSTNAVGGAKGLAAWMSPTVAMALGKTAEYRGYFSGSIYSLPYVMNALKGTEEGELISSNLFAYSLANLYGIPCVIDNTVVNTALEGATPSYEYVLDAVAPNSIIFYTRPGFIESSLNTMSCITLPLFKDMSTIIEAKPIEQRHAGVVFDNWGVILRPQLGYLVTDVLATFNPSI